MRDIVWDYRYVIILVVGIIIYSMFEWSRVKGKILNAMVAAKDLAKDRILHGGIAQENWVVNRVYQLLPVRIKLFISEELLRKIIKYLYQKSMDLLDDGQVNNSFKEDSENKETIE